MAVVMVMVVVAGAVLVVVVAVVVAVTVVVAQQWHLHYHDQRAHAHQTVGGPRSQTGGFVHAGSGVLRGRGRNARLVSQVSTATTRNSSQDIALAAPKSLKSKAIRYR